MRGAFLLGVVGCGTISLALVLGVGCGGSSVEVGGDGGPDSTTDSPSHPEGGQTDSPSTQDGRTGQDATGPSDAGMDQANDTSLPPVEAGEGSSTINCPTAPCGSGLGCCVQLTGDAGFKCEATCDNTIECLKPTDCSGSTPVCCATAVIDGTGTFPGCVESTSAFKSVTTTCESAAACPSDLKYSCKATDVVRACAAKSECTEPGYTDCCGLPVDGTTLYACVPTLAAAFLTCL
jgi:hypothetical protein